MVSTAVAFMSRALDPAGAFHAQHERRYSVGIAGDFAGEFALRQSGFFVFQHGAQDGELVGRDANGYDASPKCLIQTIPRVTQQNGHTPPAWGIDWKVIFLNHGCCLLRSAAVETSRAWK